MPSLSHELIVDMFRDRPTMAADLLESQLGFTLPKFDRVEVMSADLTNVAPTEYRADVAIKMIDGRKLVSAVIVEIQRRPDKRKRFAWPAYVGTLYSRLRYPVFLLVVCPNDKVATWCSESITIGDPPYFMMRPSVFNLQDAPVITDIAVAERSPELAVLSALAHGGKPGPEPVLKAFVAALKNVDDDHAYLYYDFVLGPLPSPARVILRSLMSIAETYRPVSDWGRRHFRNGKLEGKLEGKAEGEAEALLTVLSARGLDVSDDVRARITGCTDIEQLSTWIRRAATAETVDELFD
ncbi:hypothetical protein [Virgisporangium aurantiacum]|uniref:Uncharacterized protein n=1 Tax=Virgisporangium aurantiacum TaxID=175570 RepID=A0A8J3ZHF6_9ACTN|nr:hypothetical protein [Virgisporangium aurantiacum]GIJ61463.1 hypothetical protein Vau01_089790 [Virgisporangium aurantiacum]